MYHLRYDTEGVDSEGEEYLGSAVRKFAILEMAREFAKSVEDPYLTDEDGNVFELS